MQTKLYFMPKTLKGRFSVWMTLFGFALMYIQYWIALAFKLTIMPYFGLLAILIMIVFGVRAGVVIVWRKDRAILLFVSALIGLLGIAMIIGELLGNH